MISVAVRGYGIVIYDADDGWRTFSATESISAILSSRVESALRSLPIESEETVCEALLSLTGAFLLAQSCEHGPGGCDEDVGRN